ncbi:MAG: hypothetical protein EPN33_06825 [Acidobacteria bacterium]|nr:MAG: hypothetical protein EPN33_06825 [Acidobacteriota bacterium]
MQQREATLEDLQRLRQWVASGPLAPDGPRHKDFGSFKLCSNGEYPLTVLAPGMAAFGLEID